MVHRPLAMLIVQNMGLALLVWLVSCTLKSCSSENVYGGSPQKFIAVHIYDGDSDCSQSTWQETMLLGIQDVCVPRGPLDIWELSTRWTGVPDGYFNSTKDMAYLKLKCDGQEVIEEWYNNAACSGEPAELYVEEWRQTPMTLGCHEDQEYSGKVKFECNVEHAPAYLTRYSDESCTSMVTTNIAQEVYALGFCEANKRSDHYDEGRASRQRTCEEGELVVTLWENSDCSGASTKVESVPAGCTYSNRYDSQLRTSC
mmetsp:Transcript_44574/g.80125  ORF Transcript_44574/g.80125 Transcript_44574/m.80125 type:complete len:257 (-) Transcript_44574:30-800(-)